MVAKRVGPILVFAGMITIAVGLIAESVAEYSFLDRPRGGNFTLDFTVYQHLSDYAIFVQAVGVLLTGIAWSWLQLARSAPAVGAGGPGRERTRLGIALVLCGTLVFVGWALTWSILTEYDLSGGGLGLPNWFSLGEGLFAGSGLALWAVGWFVVRWNAN